MGTLDVAGFERLLLQQDPFGVPRGQFDLRPFNFVSPGGLIQLAAACFATREAGAVPVIVVESADVRTYLLRCGFVESVRRVARFNPPYNRRLIELARGRRGASSFLVEVTPLEAGPPFDALLDRTVDVVHRRLGYPINHAYDVARAISELGQNTFDHNGRACGFITMQGYRRLSGDVLEIGLADYGVGMRTTLSRNPKNPHVAGDAEAIELATQLGASAFDAATRGTGLPMLLELVAKYTGRIWIRTGSALGSYAPSRGQSKVIAVPHMSGVQVGLSLPAPRLN